MDTKIDRLANRLVEATAAPAAVRLKVSTSREQISHAWVRDGDG
jgi:hypothetical protein